MIDALTAKPKETKWVEFKHNRMKELYGTGVPVPFECKYACKVKSSDCAKIEKALHTAFAPNRINANREFFQIKPEQAMAILELFNRENVTQEITEEIDNDLTTEDKSATEKINSSRRPPLNYFEMGMEKGDILVFVKDPSTEVSVVDEKKELRHGDVASSVSLLPASMMVSLHLSSVMMLRVYGQFLSLNIRKGQLSKSTEKLLPRKLPRKSNEGCLSNNKQ